MSDGGNSQNPRDKDRARERGGREGEWRGEQACTAPHTEGSWELGRQRL